jgi:hypothetical protein
VKRDAIDRPANSGRQPYDRETKRYCSIGCANAFATFPIDQKHAPSNWLFGVSRSPIAPLIVRVARFVGAVGLGLGICFANKRPKRLAY